MKVRQLRAGDDLGAAVALLQRFFAEEGFDTPAETINRNAHQLAAMETCALLALEDGGKTVGVATVSSEFGLEFGWWAEMGDLYIVPEARGRGLARQLIDGVEAWLTARGIAGYQVTVTPAGEDHHGLRSYYQRLGFAGDGRVLLMKRL